jgi:putative tryptophan/tyrosine transport system substrate-binding protein
MHRREFIARLGGAAVTWPVAARAQQQSSWQRIPHVGILNYAAAQDSLVDEFRNALRELGRVEGQDLSITYRWADGQLESLPVLAAELVANNVDVIIALGPASWAAKRATTTIPIVMAFSGDPVGNGVVTNLARPGGNITGFSYMSTDLAAKRLELLYRAFSKSARVGILYNPGEPATELEMRETEAAARTIGVALLPLPTTNDPANLEMLFEAATRERVDAVTVFTHGFAVLNRARIIEQAARRRLPVMYGWREFVSDGGLMSYGPNVREMVRKAANYVDRILKGERPGDLPIQQPARLELIINLTTARALGLELPPTLLALADEVIE